MAPWVKPVLGGPPALNAPQAAAVTHSSGPLLVFAGAGSGKTRVITHRVAHLVTSAGAQPGSILAVTFTNKAAGEMRSRLSSLLGDNVAKDLWVGTFHATCARLLRRHGGAISLSSHFIIYDADDQKAVVRRALRDLGLDDRRYPPRAILGRIRDAKQELRGPEALESGSYVDDAVVKVYRLYEAQLQRANAVDFEDLIGKVVLLLEEDPGGEGAAIRRRFGHVLVDEFQDTNRAQYRLLRALTRHHRNLCVVGDDDQSIYAWRGADVRNIRGFEHDFPDATIVKLEQNYRSTGRIVKAALGVIEGSRERVPKDLWTDNLDGAPIEVVAARDERDEAAHVVGVIQDARARGTSPEEIAVFYRVHAQSRVLEEALRAVRIPYQIVGGVRFYERAEVKNALAYLRVLVNPKSDVDLLRIINTPARGIGAKTLERLSSVASSRGLSILEAIETLEEAVDDEVGSPTQLGGLTSARKRLFAVRDLLAHLAAKVPFRTPSDTLASVLDESGYVATLQAEDTPESEAKLENLRELVGSVRDYEREAEAAGDAATLDGYLERVTLAADVDSMKEASRVTLMTVHGAKGLEFQLVLLTGMEDDMLPYRGMSSDAADARDIDEERRLAYVAITRARSRLVITHVGTRQIFGSSRPGRPSRFLATIPADAAVQRATREASRDSRFVERARTFQPPPQGDWRHPFESESAGSEARGGAPGERFVDRDFFDDSRSGEADDPLVVRRGSRVVHAHFGEGEVQRVIQASEPAVMVFFPSSGEKKVLARFLRRA